MASENGDTGPDLIDRLLSSPGEFDLVPALLLLEAASRRPDAVRLSGALRNTFPDGDLSAVRGDPRDPGSVVHVVLACFGLLGPTGPLPRADGESPKRDRASQRVMSEFLAIFEHATARLLFDAATVHRPVARRFRAMGAHKRDAYRDLALAMAGLDRGAAARLPEDLASAIAAVAGVYSRAVPSANGAAGMVARAFGVPAETLEFAARWISVRESERTTLTRDSRSALGRNIALGARAWHGRGFFRLRLGPLTRERFVELGPLGDRLGVLGSLVRTYVGDEFDFDVSLRLADGEAPGFRLGAGGDASPFGRLGWSSWVGEPRGEQEVVLGPETVAAACAVD
ncbi:MAG: type VI secretion system baseplate subunit TssG [Planctomycetota bacterium]